MEKVTFHNSTKGIIKVFLGQNKELSIYAFSDDWLLLPVGTSEIVLSTNGFIPFKSNKESHFVEISEGKNEINVQVNAKVDKGSLLKPFAAIYWLFFSIFSFVRFETKSINLYYFKVDFSIIFLAVAASMVMYEIFRIYNNVKKLKAVEKIFVLERI
ncbi:hypothetical protein V7S79_05575 [Aquirufa sp. ROCK-SH2]